MAVNIFRFEKGIYDENTYLLVDKATERCAVIDPGYFGSDISALIEKTKGVSYIILTHAHGDHIRNLRDYRNKYPDARLIAEKHEKKVLESHSMNGSENITGTPISATADTYVADQDKMMLGESEMTFIFTPGHTPGGMCIYVDGFLFSGDTLFERSVGRTDLSGGSWDDLKASIINKLFILPGDTVVYPGHGSDTTIGEEKENNPYV